MENLKLRKATIKDLDFGYQVEKSAFRKYLELAVGWDENEQWQFYQKCFATQDFRVIQTAGIDCGIMSITRQTELIKVNKLFILPEYQSKGIGEAALKVIIKEATIANLPVRLQVLKVNPRALAFYNRLGFTKIGENDTHFLMEKPAE
jgi:GNAT superfamily N-acetyltransferase